MLSEHIRNQMFLSSLPSQRGEGDREKWFCLTMEKIKHILITVLHLVSVMGLLFVSLMAVTLQGNQATLAKLASIHL